MEKWIFFDNDGVLVDTEGLYFRACRAILGTVGIRLTRQDFMEISLKQGRSTFELAREKGISDNTIAFLEEKRNRLYSRLLVNGVRIMDGVENALKGLGKRGKIGVVTGSRRIHFEIIHAKSGLLPYFNFVVTCEDVARPKPAPDAYLKALAISDARPADCMVVEDSERGLAAACAAGLRCIVIPNELTAEGDFTSAFAVMPDIESATRLIQEEIFN